MQLVYKFSIRCDIETRRKLLEWCKASKNLYNQALHTYKRELKEHQVYLSYFDLDKAMKNTTNLEGEINYKLLKAQVAQQCLRGLSANTTSYFNAIKEWKQRPDKFNGMPKLPNYIKNKTRQLVFTNQACTIKDGKIFFERNVSIKIPQYEKYKEEFSHFNQVRVIPRYDGEVLECEIVYTTNETNENVDSSRFASIDLGVDNLATMVTDYSNPIIYNGKIIKSINQFWNKQCAKLKSEIKKSQNRNTSKKLTKLNSKRNTRINDIFHKVSRDIINQLLESGTGNLVVGYNKGWKDSIDLSKKVNQTFVQIPFAKLISFLEYKCRKVGINFILNEEAYTSKCDGLALEKICKHDEYAGKRVKRGLFQSSTHKLINADVNGAFNIMRKVVDDSYASKIINSGFLFNPSEVNIFEKRTYSKIIQVA